MAWSGDSGGFITTIVDLPAAAQGQPIQLRWRCGSDKSRSSPGWFIDSVVVSSYICCPDQPPPPPFAPVAGSYSGLFYEATGPRLHRSGAFTAAFTSLGAYSGSLQIGSVKSSFTGQIDSLGAGTSTVLRK